MSTIIYHGAPDELDTMEQILPANAQKERIEGELRVTVDDGKDVVQHLRIEPVN